MHHIKDPMYQLSGIFLVLLQVLAAILGGLFLFLGILAFSGSDFFSILMQWAGKGTSISFEELIMGGFVLMGLFIGCIVVFIVLQYLKNVVKKETQ